MNQETKKLPLPQGLKASVFGGVCGTAEAVPFQNRFMK
jgi:hypothetical protein